MEKVKRTPASLKKLVETFHMEILNKGTDYDTAVITVCDAFRPSLQLVGFYDYLTINVCKFSERARCSIWPAWTLASVPACSTA